MSASSDPFQTFQTTTPLSQADFSGSKQTKVSDYLYIYIFAVNVGTVGKFNSQTFCSGMICCEHIVPACETLQNQDGRPLLDKISANKACDSDQISFQWPCTLVSWHVWKLVMQFWILYRGIELSSPFNSLCTILQKLRGVQEPWMENVNLEESAETPPLQQRSRKSSPFRHETRTVELRGLNKEREQFGYPRSDCCWNGY